MIWAMLRDNTTYFDSLLKLSDTALLSDVLETYKTYLISTKRISNISDNEIDSIITRLDFINSKKEVIDW